MTTLLNTKVYASLLAQYQPKPITSESEYESTLEIISDIMFQKEELLLEESTLLETLAILVEAYEEAKFPIVASLPQDILRHLMEINSLKEDDLVALIGSKEIVSEILHNKRSINEVQAKCLGELFHVSPALFITKFPQETYDRPPRSPSTPSP